MRLALTRSGVGLTGDRRSCVSVVHRAQRAAIDHCRAGVEWRDVHPTAALAIAAGLAACGILRGDPESLVRSGAAWLFFPRLASAISSASACATPAERRYPTADTIPGHIRTCGSTCP
jgi:Xaa-Pro aminopeptidase